jgi:hypothetical protein
MDRINKIKGLIDRIKDSFSKSVSGWMDLEPINPDGANNNAVS